MPVVRKRYTSCETHTLNLVKKLVLLIVQVKTNNFVETQVGIILSPLNCRFEVFAAPATTPAMCPDVVMRSSNGIYVILKERVKRD